MMGSSHVATRYRLNRALLSIINGQNENCKCMHACMTLCCMLTDYFVIKAFQPAVFLLPLYLGSRPVLHSCEIKSGRGYEATKKTN